MIKDWIVNVLKTVKLFLVSWLSKYAFVNIGWVGGFIGCWWFLDMKILAGVCAGIFIEKNRQQLILAWKDVKTEYLKK